MNTVNDRAPYRAPVTIFVGSALGQALVTAQRDGSPSHQMIADYILRHPVRVSASSIDDLSKAIGVSSATLSRFSRTLGCAGFAEFRVVLAETLQAVLYPVEKLKDGFARALPGSERITEGLEATLANMRATSEAVSPHMLLGVTGKLTSARHVYVLGFGLSSFLAGYLAYSLSPFLRSVIHASEAGGPEITAGRMMGIGPEDCLIAITLPRYSTDMLHLAHFAKERGACVIAITDSAAAPVAALADDVLLAEAEHPVLSSCASATMLLLEALVCAVMTSQPENVARAEALTDAIASFVIGKASRRR